MADAPTAAVLRNKGCPIWLGILDDAGELELDTKGFPKKEQIYLRFSASKSAEIEETWERVTFIIDQPVTDLQGNEVPGKFIQQERIFEGNEAWQQSLQRKPNLTTIKTLAILLGIPTDEIASRMLPDQNADYSSAIGAAWSMANGLDAESAAKMLAAAAKAAKEQNEQMRVEIEKQIAAATSEDAAEPPSHPGTNGSKSGSEATSPKPEVLAAP